MHVPRVYADRPSFEEVYDKKVAAKHVNDYCDILEDIGYITKFGMTRTDAFWHA
jgi:hypothetical protein